MLEEFEHESLKWAKACNAARDYGVEGPAFAGNPCRRLLNNVDKLRANCSLFCIKYVSCYSNFNEVVDFCFSTELKPNFKEYIAKFKQSYRALNISVTSKVNAVFWHAPDFCVKGQRGLGF